MVSRFPAAGLVLLVGLAACELGSTTIPLAEPQIVVHAVLNPAVSDQTILLEESLTGKTQTGAGHPEIPILASGGIPIGDAVVQLAGSDGSVRTADEVRLGDGSATGLYLIRGAVQPGVTYTLTISALGKVVTGTTAIPHSSEAPAVPVVPFNRDHDKLAIPIAEVSGARAYWIRIEAPVSSFSVFTTDRDVEISGETRNLGTDDLLRVFTPGFEQQMTVAAMDTNLFDYYRSGNDPFSGTGLINHLQGGLGVFGSVGVIERRVIDVTQDPTGDPLEATFTVRLGGSSVFPSSIRFYIEAPAPSATGQDRISGSYVRNGSPAFRGAVLGTRNGTAIELNVFGQRQTTQPLYRISGTIRGDSLEFPVNGGTLLYVRQGK